MTKAHQEAIAFGVLALIFLGVSVAAFVRARRGGPRSQWRYMGIFGFVLCTFLFIGNLHGVVFTGPGGPSPSNHPTTSR